MLKKHPDKAGDFAGGLALLMKGSQKIRPCRNGLIFIEETFARESDVGLGEVLTGGEFFCKRGKHEGKMATGGQNRKTRQGSGASEQGGEVGSTPLPLDERLVKPAIIQERTGTGKEKPGGTTERTHSHDSEGKVQIAEKLEEPGDIGGFLRAGGNLYDIGSGIARGRGGAAQGLQRGSAGKIVTGSDDKTAVLASLSDETTHDMQRTGLDVDGNHGVQLQVVRIDGRARGIRESTLSALILAAEREDGGNWKRRDPPGGRTTGQQVEAHLGEIDAALRSGGKSAGSMDGADYGRKLEGN